VSSHRIVLTKRPVGLPTEQDFQTEEFDPGHPQSGQIAVSVRLLWLNAYMRGRLDGRKSYAAPTKLGAVPPAQCARDGGPFLDTERKRVLLGGRPRTVLGRLVARVLLLVERHGSCP
jgi:hypothetical protein